MIPHSIHVTVALALGIVAATTAGHAATFHLVSSMNGYQSPSGPEEGYPGLFYLAATVAGTSQVAPLTVTSSGATTLLGRFKSMYILESNFVGGPNGRFYSAIEYSSDPAHVFSVTSAPGSKQEYLESPLVPVFAEALPNGMLLGSAISGSTWHLVTASAAGAVSSFYEFPPKARPLSTVYATDGNYYGIVATANSPVSYVFQVAPSGSGKALHNFAPNSFSTWDPAPLVQGPNGIFYGALPTGGANHSGLIFSLTPDGNYGILYKFLASDRGGPTTLIHASDGNLYGAAINYGGDSYLFRVTPSGEYATLHSMNPGTDGICNCSLVQGSDGIIYGTSAAGGVHGGGTMFALDAGLPKPKPQALQFSPHSGPAGTQVRIWGYNLLAPTVQFNGAGAAGVTSSGPQYVLATVPAGATTGPITVTTPGGSSTTQVSFAVQ